MAMPLVRFWFSLPQLQSVGIWKLNRTSSHEWLSLPVGMAYDVSGNLPDFPSMRAVACRSRSRSASRRVKDCLEAEVTSAWH